MARTGNTWAIVFALATMTASSSGALGQELVATITPPATRSDIGRLEAKASGFIQDRDDWGLAAALLYEAAEARGALDPVAPENLMSAAHLYFYTGDTESAICAMSDTAWSFFKQGDLDRASEAMLEAAWIADKNGTETQARELAAWAELMKRPVAPTQMQPRSMT